MNRTTTISLGGQIFRIDNEACHLLNHYLVHVSAKFHKEADAEETLNDIECRIAEIFGGGQEPPILVSSDMVKDMISIMGAPEEYYDEPDFNQGLHGEQNSDYRSQHQSTYRRKEMYNPNSASAATGKAISSFFKTMGKGFSAVFRFFAIIIGFFFTVIGVLMISSIIAVAFFSDSGVVSPVMTNIPEMLKLILGTEEIVQYFIIGALVVFLPLLALINLGLVMMFRINRIPREASMALFIIWLVASCSLGIGVGTRLSAFHSSGRSVHNIEIPTPPDTLYVMTQNRIKTDDSAIASFDDFKLWKDTVNGNICGNVRLEFRGNYDESSISIERKARSFVYDEASANARAIEYESYLKGDTLFLSEYFSQPGLIRWNGSRVTVAVHLPEGTIIKPVDDTKFSPFSIPEAPYYRISRYSVVPLFD